jgi:NADH-quinone oxidoreductase subunit J
VAELLFYVLAALAVVAGIGVVACRNPLFSLLSLLGSFFCLASIYLLAGFQFLAATQLLVYAGAIMVLFLFVIMLLNLGDEAQYADRPTGLGKPRVAIAAGASGLLLLIGTLSVGLRPVAAATGPGAAGPAAGELAQVGGIDDVQALGEVLFSRFVLPFEAASLLLLATMIAVILLAKRQRGDDEVGWPWKRGER